MVLNVCPLSTLGHRRAVAHGYRGVSPTPLPDRHGRSLRAEHGGVGRRFLALGGAGDGNCEVGTAGVSPLNGWLNGW